MHQLLGREYASHNDLSPRDTIYEVSQCKMSDLEIVHDFPY